LGRKVRGSPARPAPRAPARAGAAPGPPGGGGRRPAGGGGRERDDRHRARVAPHSVGLVWRTQLRRVGDPTWGPETARTFSGILLHGVVGGGLIPSMTDRPSTPVPPNPGQPKLLDRLRAACRVRHYSIRTEDAYADWVVRFVKFHNVRHPDTMAEPEVNAFLPPLAVQRQVSASTQNQALCALVFLYAHVLARPLDELSIIRAARPHRLPVVLSRDEVRKVLAELEGVHRLVGLLLYGSGLRLVEWLRMRGKDPDFELGQVTVRGGEGDKGRVAVLPG